MRYIHFPCEMSLSFHKFDNKFDDARIKLHQFNCQFFKIVDNSPLHSNATL